MSMREAGVKSGFWMGLTAAVVVLLATFTVPPSRVFLGRTADNGCPRRKAVSFSFIFFSQDVMSLNVEDISSAFWRICSCNASAFSMTEVVSRANQSSRKRIARTTEWNDMLPD